MEIALLSLARGMNVLPTWAIWGLCRCSKSAFTDYQDFLKVQDQNVPIAYLLKCAKRRFRDVNLLRALWPAKHCRNKWGWSNQNWINRWGSVLSLSLRNSQIGSRTTLWHSNHMQLNSNSSLKRWLSSWPEDSSRASKVIEEVNIAMLTWNFIPVSVELTGNSLLHILGTEIG